MNNDTQKMIKTHKGIAISYLTGWFLLDTISIFPFEQVLTADSSFGNVN
jgi:hypothetical protein